MKELEQTIKFQVRTGHIRFYNQLWAGTDKAGLFITVCEAMNVHSIEYLSILIAVIGEWLTAILNSSMYTYEVSPVFTMCVSTTHTNSFSPRISFTIDCLHHPRMELYILERLRKLAGWTDGDGAFAPGGAHCNLLAMLAARNHALPRLRKVCKKIS